MKCYDTEILSRYQDGSLDEAENRRIDEHLLGCASCRETLRSLGRAGLLLRIALGGRKSSECLSDEETGSYLSGLMSAEDRRRVEEHLQSCRRCLHEVATLSDAGMFRPDGDSPEPDAGAIERFGRLAPTAVVADRRAGLRVFAGWGLRAAAAAVLAAICFGRVWSPTVVTGHMATSEAVGEARSFGPILAEVSLSDGASVAGTSTELSRFARDAGNVLQEIERVCERPSADRLDLVREDILGSGLVDSVSRLKETTRDARDRKFLADCEFVLMSLAKTDVSDVAGASDDLARIVSEIRRLNLVETARLVEMEGGRSQWLASL